MEYVHSFDERGRLVIPVAFRRGKEVILIKGPDRCIRVYFPREWEGFHFFTNHKTRRLKRFIFSSEPLKKKLDNGRRISIPDDLRKYASLTPGKKVIIVKVNNYLEIWNEESRRDRPRERA